MKLFRLYGIQDIVMCDSKGILSSSRTDLSSEKQNLVEMTNPRNISGTLKDAVRGADVFVGLSAPNALATEDVRTMNQDSIIFAMANPIPEIMPEDARAGGASVGAGASERSAGARQSEADPGPPHHEQLHQHDEQWQWFEDHQKMQDSRL